MATKFDAQLARALEKEQQKTVSLFRFPSYFQLQTKTSGWIPDVETPRLKPVCLFPAFLLVASSVADVSTPPGCLDRPQSIVGGLPCAAECR